MLDLFHLLPLNLSNLTMCYKNHLLSLFWYYCWSSMLLVPNTVPWNCSSSTLRQSYHILYIKNTQVQSRWLDTMTQDLDRRSFIPSIVYDEQDQSFPMMLSNNSSAPSPIPFCRLLLVIFFSRPCQGRRRLSHQNY
jgi:hypothetical protein